MKQILTVLLCLLLCGCTQSPDTSEATPETPTAPEKVQLYDPDHPIEKAYPGEVRAYPLPRSNTHGMRGLGSDLLILSGDGATRLTVLTGENLCEAASLTLEFDLRQDDPSLQVHENGISFFDPTKQETLLLDSRLQEVRRIAGPQGLSGKPLLSRDTGTLYYCTGWSVMAWDLESGIRRTVKELSYSSQELTALLGPDPILECTIQDGENTNILLLSSENGTELDLFSHNIRLETNGSGYFAVFPEGFQNRMVFGRSNSSPEFLLPIHPADQQFYLPEDHGAVTARSSEDGISLDYYELNTGILRRSVALESLQSLKNIINTTDHAVFILAYDPAAGRDILYRWDVLRQAPDTSNTTVHTFPYSSPEAADRAGLEQCLEHSRSIGEKYGITIAFLEDACAVQPWDYRFTPEFLAPVLEQELELLDQRLSRYPREVLERTVSHFTGLTLCLVREITGTPESGSLESATGIQFLEDGSVYVAITAGNYSEQALYHELYHVMDTHILTESTALDQWESLNPAAFSYSSGGLLPEDSEIYLSGQTRAFVDRYSMHYPKEDRARIFECAMREGTGEIFRSEYMQRKLTALCTGIREAYGLKKLPETLPWEQYLVTPLTPAP